MAEIKNSEILDLPKFKISETFVVDFVIEAKDYRTAKSVYDKMFDENIKLGYANWKNILKQDIKGGKFFVKTKDQDVEATVIEDIWGEEE